MLKNLKLNLFCGKIFMLILMKNVHQELHNQYWIRHTSRFAQRVLSVESLMQM